MKPIPVARRAAMASSDTAADAATEAPDPTKREVDQAQPRLVVATDTGAKPGRNRGDAGLTQVLDAGSWTSAHGGVPRRRRRDGVPAPIALDEPPTSIVAVGTPPHGH